MSYFEVMQTIFSVGGLGPASRINFATVLHDGIPVLNVRTLPTVLLILKDTLIE